MKTLTPLYPPMSPLMQRYADAKAKLPRWVGVRDVFTWGSTTSIELCRHFGVDPHELVEGVYPNDRPEESEEP